MKRCSTVGEHRRGRTVRGNVYAPSVKRLQPTEATMDLQNLPEYWDQISRAFASLDALQWPTRTDILSARAFDEAQPAGRRSYMEVVRYLGVARDNHEALVALLEHHGATLWAPWSLLRPAFEASFLACWILDPSDGAERRARGLRCEILDAYEQRRHRSAFKVFPQVRRLIEDGEAGNEAGSISTYRAEASALGRNFDKLNQRINVVDELKKLTIAQSDPHFAPQLEATWRLLSGYEHGFGWAMLAGSDRSNEVAIPGGASAHFVINDEAFVLAAKSTYLLLLTGCRLLRQRTDEPAQRAPRGQ